MKIFFWIMLVILLIMGSWIYDIQQQKTYYQQLSSSIVQAPIVDELVAYVIGAPPNTIVTASDIEAGKYPIEAIEVAPDRYIIDRASRYGRLWYFDSTHDGILDSRDPVFARFAFGYINPNTHIIHFVPMIEAGLRAINIDPTHLTPESTRNLPLGYWGVHSKLIMADGSQGITYHVAVSSSFIAELKTDPNSHQELLLPGQSDE